LKIGKEGQP